MHCTDLDWELPNTLKRIRIESVRTTDSMYTATHEIKDSDASLAKQTEDRYL